MQSVPTASYETGKEASRFAWEFISIEALSHSWCLFAPDGKAALVSPGDGSIRIWDVKTGKELRRMSGHAGIIRSAAFHPLGKLLATAGADGTIRLWDWAAGQEVCRLAGFPDGTWAVTDPAGRYDAANAGDIAGVRWVVGTEPIDLKQLKNRYYEPGLLAKVLGLNPEPLR